MTSIHAIKRYLIPFVIIFAFFAINNSMYKIYGQAIFYSITPKEIIVENIQFDYHTVRIGRYRTNQEPKYYITFYHGGKKKSGLWDMC